MPEEVQTDTIESHLSDKGVLTICATKTMISSLHEVPLFEHAQRNRKHLQILRFSQILLCRREAASYIYMRLRAVLEMTYMTALS
ncbi:unnamed protein product [Brugia pahangi]|uniref:Protein-tyrosine-phosphatase n=1 Tax=Brugia pahangi TaxID=6280 RepID=A0A0N4T591_BRUPA|nr:unnamed protein product [Brugia pahangi]